MFFTTKNSNLSTVKKSLLSAAFFISVRHLTLNYTSKNNSKTHQIGFLRTICVKHRSSSVFITLDKIRDSVIFIVLFNGL